MNLGVHQDFLAGSKRCYLKNIKTIFVTCSSGDIAVIRNHGKLLVLHLGNVFMAHGPDDPPRVKPPPAAHLQRSTTLTLLVDQFLGGRSGLEQRSLLTANKHYPHY
jgi:hypothetical protein